MRANMANTPEARRRPMSHEAEDADRIPEDLRNDDLLDPTNKVSPAPSMHRALNESRRQGRRGSENLLRTPELLNMENPSLSLDGRKASFQRQWSGPCARLMADAGFHYHDTCVARCAFCCVTIRGWRPDHCPWARHKAFSPNCAHLRRKGEHGIRPTAPGRRVRSFSFSAVEEMKAGCDAD